MCKNATNLETEGIHSFAFLFFNLKKKKKSLLTSLTHPHFELKKPTTTTTTKGYAKMFDSIAENRSFHIEYSTMRASLDCEKFRLFI
jgi:hypothetical protein